MQLDLEQTHAPEVKKNCLADPAPLRVRRAEIFGSCARGHMTGASDIDILVETGKHMSLFEFVRLKHELEAALERQVDLVEYKTIKPRLKDILLKEELAIL